MHAPKLLPWIARKAGITEREALAIWEDALARAALQAGAPSGAGFHRLALEHFVAHAHAAARPAKPAAPAPGVHWGWQRPLAQACPG